METIRLAKKNELSVLKEIWKLCFGDRDDYIDFYYRHRYREEETVVLEQDGRVVSMVTVFPVQTVSPDNQRFDSVMLYAFATHPQYQGRGFATQIMNYCHLQMLQNNQDISVLVPEGEELFEFYRRQGYRESFDIGELVLTEQRIKQLMTQEPVVFRTTPCQITPVDPKVYNLRRDKRLQGRFHIAYSDQDILYQKKLSKTSKADIYGIDMGKEQGCAVVERISSETLLVKELLISEELILVCMNEIAEMHSAKKYICRIPPYLGKQWGEMIRPFGMMKEHRATCVKMGDEEHGYMGLAFD